MTGKVEAVVVPAAKKKAGYKTTEFWLSVVAGLTQLQPMLAETANSSWNAIAMALIAGAYSYSRAKTKSSPEVVVDDR